ncbi:MAG: hypothetical protein M1828_000763 [Chrysothrix sp. TS-e1954]|nr:MAG: hypothetical protein M1828_000763 [Chrysothrix sp. TS-e1954]
MFSRRLLYCLGFSFFLSTTSVLLWQAQRANLIQLPRQLDITRLKDKFITPEKPLDFDFYHNSSFHNDFESQITNATLGFGRILTISLPARADHRERLNVGGGATGIEFNYVDGVLGSDVDKSNIPPKDTIADKDLGALGAWRAHLNALEEVVASNLSSALITEDDVDWDIRIKSQLLNVAAGTRTIMQPLRTEKRNDDRRHSGPAPITVPPSSTPYGDGWDVLWLGFCRMQPPLMHDDWLRKARYIIPDDETVPSYKHWHPAEPRILDEYPEHTRIVSHAKMGLCSLAYAVTQQGAQRVLHQMKEDKFRAGFDVMLYQWCEHGHDNTCLTTMPQVINHHRAAGRISDDSDLRGGMESDDIREKGETLNIRWSTMLNIEKLLNNQTDYEDQFPD